MTISRVSTASLFFWVFLSFFPGNLLAAVVTLNSIEIYRTHEWFKAKPTVYFRCMGENNTVLPDVKEANVSYAFKGQESWQPLTEFSNEKCKRCGFYEEDTLNSDDTFEEWEFCPSDFSSSDGRYTRIKDKEFTATFLCPQCVPIKADINTTAAAHRKGRGVHVAPVIMISVLVLTVLLVGLVAAYKYWQKKKREHEQARFLKLFEDGDDIEDELGLGTVL